MAGTKPPLQFNFYVDSVLIERAKYVTPPFSVWGGEAGLMS